LPFGIVYRPDKENATGAIFHENNLVFRVVHEKVCIFAVCFINVVKRGKDAIGSFNIVLMIGEGNLPNMGGKSRTMGKAADGISRETDKEPR
jgi:hypothetical protein